MTKAVFCEFSDGLKPVALLFFWSDFFDFRQFDVDRDGFVQETAEAVAVGNLQRNRFV